MTPEEIGHIYSFLLKKRIARSFKSKNIDSDERYIGDLLERNLDKVGDLQSFLASQQLKLEILDAQANGLGGRGNAFVLIPNHTDTEILPAHLRTKELWDAVKDGSRNEPKYVSVVWTSYLYLHLLYTLYTQENRSIEAISSYSDTWVTDDEFTTRIIDEIEDLRTKTPPGDGEIMTIAQVLTEAKVTDIGKRVNRFLKAMERFKVLERKTPTETGLNFQESNMHIYIQTLWSAVDIARNFYRNASLVLNLPSAQSIKELSE